MHRKAKAFGRFVLEQLEQRRLLSVAPAVVVGGTINEADLLNAASSSQFRSEGGGLYLHASGWAELSKVQRQQVAQLFAGTGEAFLEFGYSDNPKAWAGLYTSQYVPNGITASAVNVNYPSDISQVGWQAYVDAMRAAGVPTVLPVASPNSAVNAWQPGFYDSRFQGVRDLATYGGGITTDAPPSFYLAMPDGYRTYTQNEIQWANANGLKSVSIISPHTSGIHFLADTEAFVRQMEEADAIPQQYVVENYLPKETPGYVNAIGTETNSSNVLGVGLWLNEHVQGSPHTLQLSAASSGATPAGTSSTSTTSTGFAQTLTVDPHGASSLSYTLSLTNLSQTGGQFYIPQLTAVAAGDASQWKIGMTYGGQDITASVMGGGYTFYSSTDELDPGVSRQIQVTLTPLTAQAEASPLNLTFSAKAHPDAATAISTVQINTLADPTVTVAAQAVINPVAPTSATLSALGADFNGESGLTYTWSTTGALPAPVTFSNNGTNASNETTAVFSKAGNYTFTVVIQNANGGVATSSVTVAVNQTVASATLAPHASALADATTYAYKLISIDQFGAVIASPPAFAWTVAPGGAGGAITSAGQYTAPAAATGTDTIIATSGSISVTTVVSVTSAGIFNNSADIGAVGQQGYYSYSNGTYSVSGGGSDIWNRSDQFHFVFSSVSGDAVAAAQVTTQSNTNSWAKAGLMLRASSAANSMFADIIATPGQGVSFQWRSATGGPAVTKTVAKVHTPVWVKLVRSGNSVGGFYSMDDITWTAVGSAQTIIMATTADIGLAVTAHNSSALSTVTLANVSLAAAPALINSGFELPALQGGYAYTPANTGWTFSGGGGITGNNNAFTSGNPPAPEGLQAAFLQGVGSFSQTLGGWEAGTYTLSFAAAQRGNHSHGGQNFRILVDGAVVGTFTPSSTTYAVYSITFKVLAGSHTLTFKGVDSAGGDNTAFVDNLHLTLA